MFIAPHLSKYISLGLDLSDRPPVSNVTPLPIKHRYSSLSGLPLYVIFMKCGCRDAVAPRPTACIPFKLCFSRSSPAIIKGFREEKLSLI